MSKVDTNEFVKLHDQLLKCYANVFPNQYLQFDAEEQKHFCQSERMSLESVFLENKISIDDFFNEKLKK